MGTMPLLMAFQPTNQPTKTYTAISDISNDDELQNGLLKLNEWANKWQISIANVQCYILAIKMLVTVITYNQSHLTFQLKQQI
jgi:hypothetical protein